MPLTDTNRLATVNSYKHLELNDNKELNDLISQSSKICNTTMASLTLLGEHVQWIKCGSGIINSQENVEDSFCKYTINTYKIMEVPNALLDVRFVNNPSVTGSRHIRFYAGFPLVTASGFHLGALCVYDEQPHKLSREQRSMLTFIAKQVMHMLEMLLGLNTHKLLHAKHNEVVEANLQLKTFSDNSATIHLVMNKNLHVVNFNKAASAFMKKVYPQKLQAGKNILSFVSTSFRERFLRYVKKAFTGKPSNKEVLIRNPGQVPQWWDVNFHPVQNNKGDIVSVACSASNIHQEKEQVAAIISQNSSLLKIAFVQSHVYRKSVASILGLMNVIKANNYRPTKASLVMMESAVMELDEKIKDVVSLSEEGIVEKVMVN